MTTHKVLLITGASSGIGASFATYLAEKGMHVLLTARRKEKLVALQESITKHGGNASIFPADLSNANARVALYEEIMKTVNAVDIVIRNSSFVGVGSRVVQRATIRDVMNPATL